MTTATQTVNHRGIVKQVLSGDTIVIRGQPKGGPPPEQTFCLSNVSSPRLARRPNAPGNTPLDAKDEPYAWEAREFVRKKLIGKEIFFTTEYKTPAGREYGCVHMGKDEHSESLTELLVAEGLVSVRREGIKANDESQQKLIQLEESAKASGKGKWGPPEDVALHVRDVKWTLDNPSIFVDSLKGVPVDAVIEHVRDGCTVRAFLLPSFHYVTVMLSGIKCSMFKMEGTGSDAKQVAEPFAAEAKFYTESRLLNRDVQIILEGVVNQNVMGTILHPNGNISEMLLKEGFARCADWSMGYIKEGANTLRSAEKLAKEKQLRLWKDYERKTAVDVKDKNFTSKVVEIVNGDGMVVKMVDNSFKKVFLASIRSPRPLAEGEGEEGKKKDPKNRPRPLYDFPYMFDAREYLRKKLIGKKVNILVDYVQPKSEQFPEKTCCTITISNINIAEALVSKGLATVIRYRQDDDQRSSQYDKLLAAEKQAEKKAVGVHSKKDQPVLKVADVSGDVGKAKQFFPFLQRAGRSEALVEFVASGSRLRLYIPKETCLVTFLISGIECPRGSRPDPAKTGATIPSDPYGEEAMLFTKELVMQREVEVEIEMMDKGGNFIGWLIIDGVNLSVALVEAGLAKVHFTAERSSYYKVLCDAEKKAKAAMLNIWKDYVEPVEKVPVENEPQERNCIYKTIVVTDIAEKYHFYAQHVDTGPQLEALMEQLRTEFSANPPLAHSPKKGETVAAKFPDGEWYRAKVEKVEGAKVYVSYIDYGNKEVTNSSKLAVLPAGCNSLPPQAHEYALACIQLPQDEEDIQNAMDALYGELLNKKFQLNVEYRRDGIECVTLTTDDDKKDDVGLSLVAQGYVLVEQRREKRLADLQTQYRKAQDKAKADRVNLWRYGDFTEDDAREFGYQ